MEELRKLLQRLAGDILRAVNEGRAKGTLQPDYMRCFRWKVTEFEYGDKGITKKSSTGEEFLKPFWSTNEVFQKVSKLKIYSEIYKAVSEHYNLGEGQVNDYLHQLITRLAREYLEAKAKTVADVTKHVDSFLKDLNGEEQICGAKVQLRGLILQPNSIQLDGNVRLRKPNRKDFEIEEAADFPPLRGGFLESPTAFLHIGAYAKADTSSIVLRNEIDRAVAILRLFRVGAIQDIQYSQTTDSIIGMSRGTHTRGRLLGSADRYLITRRDVKGLKSLWTSMKGVRLPGSAYPEPQQESDELSIAYERYTDSLDTHLLEKRISSAVMGLEALYLGGVEQQEMSYRLRLRVSKLLSLIGYDPNEVQEGIRDSYEVRSKYVHGGILHQKDKKKLETKYGDLSQFSKKIMDYLRASIVALLKRPSKTSLIRKIDDSFLNGKQEEEIKKLIFIPY